MSLERLLDHKLNHGWVTLDRETVDGDTLLHFAVEIDAAFSADVIFEQLILGMTDTPRSWLWPSEYESSPDAAPAQIEEGDALRMTYRVPRFDRPGIPAKPVTYSYVWHRFRPSDREFEYRSIDHPLSGGAVVRVVPTSASTCRLTWVGAYKQLPGQAIVVQSMVQYIPFLYGKFEENLEARARSTGGH